MMANRIAGVALASLLLAGCSIGTQDAKALTTGSLKPRSDSSAKQGRNAGDTLRSFCGQRHVDYQAGKAPGGAKSLGQKQADDRLCEAIGRQG